MKNYMCLFLFVFISICFTFINTSASQPLKGKVFVLDAGHGGVDPGVVVDGVFEKDINLAITLKLKSSLETYGARVILTRQGDYDLGVPNALYRKKSDFDNRLKIINNSGADYYISIHLNYLSDSAYDGIQVFYTTNNQELAIDIQDFLNDKLGGTREAKAISSSIYMYSKIEISGVLIECGFLSNEKEKEKLLDEEYQKQIATFIAESFFKI